MLHHNKYLVITEYFLPRKGGSTVWFDEVYRRIGSKEVHIVTGKMDGALEYDKNHPNTIHRLNLQRKPWLRPESLAIYGNLLRKCMTLALFHRFNLIHAGRVLSEGLVGLAVARVMRVPLVIYAHGDEITTWREPQKYKAMVFTYNRADCVIANSEFTRDMLIEMGINSERIVLIYPGVDVERFRPGLYCEDLRSSLRLGKNQKLILSVGRLIRRKGFDHVIRAMPLLASQAIDVRYAVIGTGEDYDYLKSIARETGVADRVHLLGEISRDEFPRWYNAADVFATPNRKINSEEEGFGLVFLEAAACGKPSVAGLSGGTGSAVVHGVTGLRVRGESTEDVASALALILTDTKLAAEMGERARARAQFEFSWDAVARKTIDLEKYFWTPASGGNG